jgi:3-dehydroquinate synthetase
VAIGMSLVAHAAVRRGMLSEDVAQRIDRVLTQLGLSLDMPASINEVLREVKYDKKKNNNSIRLIVPKDIGECAVEVLSFEELEQMFK